VLFLLRQKSEFLDKSKNSYDKSKKCKANVRIQTRSLATFVLIFIRIQTRSLAKEREEREAREAREARGQGRRAKARA